jgi:hypothetical protein
LLDAVMPLPVWYVPPLQDEHAALFTPPVPVA